MSAVAYPTEIMAPLVARSLELSQYAADPASVAHSQLRAARRSVAAEFGRANGWVLAPKDDTGLPRDVGAHNAEWRDDVADTFPNCMAIFYASRDSARICAIVLLAFQRPDDDGLPLEELPDSWVKGRRTFVVRLD